MAGIFDASAMPLNVTLCLNWFSAMVGFVVGKKLLFCFLEGAHIARCVPRTCGLHDMQNSPQVICLL